MQSFYEQAARIDFSALPEFSGKILWAGKMLPDGRRWFVYLYCYRYHVEMRVCGIIDHLRFAEWDGEKWVLCSQDQYQAWAESKIVAMRSNPKQLEMII